MRECATVFCIAFGEIAFLERYDHGKVFQAFEVFELDTSCLVHLMQVVLVREVHGDYLCLLAFAHSSNLKSLDSEILSALVVI